MVSAELISERFLPDVFGCLIERVRTLLDSKTVLSKTICQLLAIAFYPLLQEDVLNGIGLPWPSTKSISSALKFLTLCDKPATIAAFVLSLST